MNTSATSHIAPLVHSISLDNGLRIHVLRREFAPTFMAYYHFGVGSAHDPKGASGIAHLLEHMMFKGTRRIGVLEADEEQRLMAELSERWHELQRELDGRDDPFHGGDEKRIAQLQAEIDSLTAAQKELVLKNEYAELITRAGGSGMNATTSNDVTRYFVQLPANQLEMWFRLESQRLLEPVFREFYTERDVVLEERRLRTDNQPEGQAFEALRRLLYSAHPYGTPVIGWPRDIERLTREDALEYFRTWYSPSNCVMVLVGDIDPARVRELAEQHLGAWERQELPHVHMTAEPVQRGVRRQVVEFDAEPHLRMAWNTVPEGHADHYALSVLSGLLGELTSSRLNQQLVNERQIAAGAASFHFVQKHGGSFNIVVRPRDDHDLSKQEEAVLEIIGTVAENGVDEAELQRAKINLEAARVRRQSSNQSLGMDLGSAVLASGGPEYLDEFEARVEAVSAADVQAVAARYLRAERRCVVEVRRPVEGDAPAAAGGAGGAAASVDSTDHAREAAPSQRGAAHSPGFREMLDLIESAPPVNIHIPQVGRDVERLELPCGITAFLKEDHSLPAMNLSLNFNGGSNRAPIEELARYSVAGPLLLEGGTAELDPADLDRRREELGLRLNLRMGTVSTTMSLWSLRRNFDASLRLMADVLRRPRLDEDRLDVLKAKHYEMMRRRFDYPSWGIWFLGQKVLHGEHPRLGYQASKAEMEALGPADVLDCLHRHLGPQNLFLTAVGDFERDEFVEQLERAFGGWEPAVDPERDWIAREPSLRPGVFVVNKELPQPAVRILQELPVDRDASEEEHAALEILNRILGGSSFRSRLMERLRSDEGLTYGISSSLAHQGRPGVPGSFTVGYQTRMDAVARSIDSVLEECGRIREQAVSPQEVHEQIQSWRNQFIFRFENEAFAVARLMNHELDDRPYDRDRQQLEQIERVTPEQVLAVAQRYLDPDQFSVTVFGSLTDADEGQLQSRLGLTRLERDEVFAGGY